MHDRFRHRLLGMWSHLMARHPKWVLFAALGLAVGSIVLTVMKLEFQPDRNDLLARSIPWNQEFIGWQKRFPGKDDLIVIVDAGRPDEVGVFGGPEDPPKRHAAIRDFIEALAVDLKASPYIRSVEWGYPRSQFSARTMRLLPMDEFKARLAQLAESKTMLQSPSVPKLLGNVMASLQASESAAPPPGSDENAQMRAAMDRLDRFTRLVQSLHKRLEANPASHGNDPTRSTPLAMLLDPEADPSRMSLLTEDDRFYFIRVKPLREEGRLNEFEAAIENARLVIARHEDRKFDKDPVYTIGLTGIPVIEMDETDAATLDSTIASIISVILIYCLLMAAFYSVRTPLFAILSLLVGVAWAFGYTTLRIGHLQVISVVFTVMLLGLGIAYGIHLSSRFELVRHRYARGPGGFAASLRDTIETIGPGVITGAVTTAAAFLTTLFTDFKGVAEMGEIAGVGIMLCLLAMFSVYPAFMRLARAKHKHFKPMEHRDFHFFEEHWVTPFWKKPVITMSVTVVLVAGSIAAMTQMYFDFNLLKLFPRGVASVQWQNTLSEAGRPIYFGAAVCETIPQARNLANRLREQPTVADRFGGIGLLFPPNDDDKIALIETVKPDLAPAAESAMQEASISPAEADMLPAFRTLNAAFALAGFRTIPDEVKPALNRLQHALAEVTKYLSSLPEEERLARCIRVHHEYSDMRSGTAAQVKSVLDTTPLSIEDFPLTVHADGSLDGLLAPYIDPLDTDRPPSRRNVVLEIYPDLSRGGTAEPAPSILDPMFLPQYVDEMEALAQSVTGKHVTGPAPQIYRSGQLIRDSYKIAGLFALAVVIVLVYLDFHRLADVLLCLVPVSVGFSLTFGIMYVSDMHVNPANIIVLPLMFGIGVDAGVHMLHRYRQSPDDRPLGLTGGTGKGITITNLATMIGFGSMLLARHRGVQSLGFVLTVGIGLTTLACWIVMPALLELLQRHRVKKAT